MITALFHDFGYLRKRGDRRRRYGAEYTLTHVTRGSRHLRGDLPQVGLKRYAEAVADAPSRQSLRRALPKTLNKGVEPYPKDLVIR